MRAVRSAVKWAARWAAVKVLYDGIYYQLPADLPALAQFAAMLLIGVPAAFVLLHWGSE